MVECLIEEYKGTPPIKMDDKANLDNIVADSASMESWVLDADETANQDQGKVSNGSGTHGQQGTRLKKPPMSGSNYHQHQ